MQLWGGEQLGTSTSQITSCCMQKPHTAPLSKSRYEYSVNYLVEILYENSLAAIYEETLCCTALTSMLHICLFHKEITTFLTKLAYRTCSVFGVSALCMCFTGKRNGNDITPMQKCESCGCICACLVVWPLIVQHKPSTLMMWMESCFGLRMKFQ